MALQETLMDRRAMRRDREICAWTLQTGASGTEKDSLEDTEQAGCTQGETAKNSVEVDKKFNYNVIMPARK